jgi:hypothetical protein
MTIQWWFLMPTLIFSAVGVGSFYIRRAELQSGRALLGISTPLSWSRDRHPLLFRMRLASYWIFIGFCAVAALSFLVQFLGIVR